jgi:hypothetical protein
LTKKEQWRNGNSFNLTHCSIDAAMAALSNAASSPATLGGIAIEADMNINVNCELPKR